MAKELLDGFLHPKTLVFSLRTLGWCVWKLIWCLACCSDGLMSPPLLVQHSSGLRVPLVGESCES